MNELKRLRLDLGLTQQETAKKIGVSLRSYVTYENDETKANTPKYRFLLSELTQMKRIDEAHGLLTIDKITSICGSVFPNYRVDFCYLFGSYAKDKAVPSSDVDLLISTKTTGLQFYELTEILREKLQKKVDLIETKQLLNNEDLLCEVLKDGIKIYG
ncbi:MAG: nucleotidyltransferase domain-containing protein [Firmicutes bacterium]|nr:nucleotidyltransferase domain-containing protein [Bacillota bacterium]